VILLSVALPGRFAQWCDAVMVRLAGRLGGAVASETWPPLDQMFGFGAGSSTLDALGRLMIGSSAQHLVIGARQPDERLRQALAARNVPFLLALDDPRDAAADILGETGADPRIVVRAVANSCPLVMQFDGLPGVLALHADHGRSDPAAAVSAIAAHFGIAVGAREIAAIVQELAPLAAGQSSGQRPAPADLLPAAAGKMLEGALAGYRRCFRDGRLDQIVWTRDLFYLAADGTSPSAPVEVAGGARVLIYGPYIHLPPGSWSAQVILGFSPETTRSRFLVDVYADGQLACTTFQPGATGVYSADMSFSLGEPSGKGVEVRVTVANHDAAGRVAFGRVVLQPLAMRRPDGVGGSEDFASVLQL
jgi:hypothetical protein